MFLFLHLIIFECNKNRIFPKKQNSLLARIKIPARKQVAPMGLNPECRRHDFSIAKGFSLWF